MLRHSLLLAAFFGFLFILPAAQPCKNNAAAHSKRTKGCNDCTIVQQAEIPRRGVEGDYLPVRCLLHHRALIDIIPAAVQFCRFSMPARLPVLIQVSRDHFAARKNVFVRRQPAHNRVFLFGQSEVATGVVCIGNGNRLNIIAFFIQHLDDVPPAIAAVDVRPICCNIRNPPR